MTKTRPPARPAPTQRAKMSPKVKHEKLHVKRGIVMPGCKWCVPEPIEEPKSSLEHKECQRHAIILPCPLCAGQPYSNLEPKFPPFGEPFEQRCCENGLFGAGHECQKQQAAEVLEDIPAPDTSTSRLVEECRVIAEQLDNTLYQDYGGLVKSKPTTKPASEFTSSMAYIAAGVMLMLLYFAVSISSRQGGIRSQAQVVQAVQKHAIAAEKQAITALSERDQARSELDDLKGQYEVAVAMLKGALEQLQKQAQYITGDRRWHAQDDTFWKKYHGRTVIVDPADSAKEPDKEWRVDPGIQYSVDDFVGSQGKKKQ